MSGASPRWSVQFTALALEMLSTIKDLRVRDQILRTAERLDHEPAKQGKPMTGDLAGLRSLRAVGQRYRILYSVDGATVTVHVLAVGIRKEGDKGDIYALAQRLFRQGLLDVAPPAEHE